MREDYETLWADARAALRANRVTPDPVPTPGSPRWGVSAILRPGGSLVATLSGVVSDLVSLAGDDQLPYDHDMFHVTIRSLETYRDEVEADDIRVRGYCEMLRRLCSRLAPPAIAVRGLTANRAAVFAQGWPNTNALRQFRVEFEGELVAARAPLGPEKAARRRTAHACLMQLRGPIKHPGALVDYVAGRRDAPYGEFRPRHIEVVRYDFTGSTIALVPLARIPWPLHA